MQESQNYKNHTRFDPPFHFVLVPILLINVIFTLVVMIHHWGHQTVLHAWLFIIAIVLLMMLGTSRRYANGVQDRVIRLEERLRYAQLLTPEQMATSQALTVRQIVALRFASDAELPALMQRAVAEQLPPKAIKQAITVWRPDNLRV